MNFARGRGRFGTAPSPAASRSENILGDRGELPFVFRRVSLRGENKKCTTCDPVRRFIPPPLRTGVNPSTHASIPDINDSLHTDKPTLQHSCTNAGKSRALCIPAHPNPSSHRHALKHTHAHTHARTHRRPLPIVPLSGSGAPPTLESTLVPSHTPNPFPAIPSSLSLDFEPQMTREWSRRMTSRNWL
ncbi:DNA replication terminus site-binding protein [Labeo rohita]|uniref:DNA replication terminus site-binding protein n=1 Tax=Labeo rohita TaxID=84645 RepID=A0ABQ8MAL0_LABRO|nr:DNA replication terminus site-binding protein [Labeo rohita]